MHRKLIMLWCLLILAVPGSAQESRNIRFGKPVPATAYANPKTEDIAIVRTQYVLSYNSKNLTPNWVSWNLLAGDIGTQERGAFEADPLLKDRASVVHTGLYDGTGFDRGHMCPSKDRSRDAKDNDATFYLSNVVPQAPDNNEKTWEHLEAYCRKLALAGASLHIVCGPYGRHGQGSSGFANYISKFKIVVPSHTWKVILVLPDKFASADKRTRTIAVMVPNQQGIDPDWTKYRCSIAHVEETTGYTFFPALPKTIAEVIKSATDRTPVTFRDGSPLRIFCLRSPYGRRDAPFVDY